ncbi:hypothetical protein [Acidithiobacillus sulfurivorans]|uniref:Integrase n=1 Tax=Acidithiobacillus sulfurivorans TaxID=1958756 RepID=A0ABS5ZYK1_9PROT|nr:hypothetical protein [Acidithiobacillus sulfurivorans]MBU2760297.1 hypothetical protein [Acidithiobacillus sulfurivorans]
MITFKKDAHGGYAVLRKTGDGLHKVATIHKGQAEWVLKSSTGRIDRFDTLKEAKDDALRI